MPLLKYFRILVIALASLLIVTNFVSGFFGVMAQIVREQQRPPLEPGIQYADLKKSLSGIRIAGFLTDGDATAEGNDGQFMLAQYMLAPTILDLNNSDHHYSIINCSTPEKAMGILKIINAKPLQINMYGKIIAERNL